MITEVSKEPFMTRRYNGLGAMSMIKPSAIWFLALRADGSRYIFIAMSFIKKG
tara:strand:- start:401 stop:559 length:159 start_codon:yes stop_codon:yes gene_type:complete